mmetsp:Transcript_2084/g.6533  ORF Transcript_2084/g.6533 Transcript_2084/m.6533 type:complete len:217 (+) Transcript_2084:390-1040(+)
MVSGLPELKDEVKNVCVVVKHSAFGNVGVKLSPALCVGGSVNVPLLFIQCATSQTDLEGGQLDVSIALRLRPPQEELLQDLLSQLLHGHLASTEEAKPLDGIGHFRFEVTLVMELRVVAVPAARGVRIEDVAEHGAGAVPFGTEVVGVGVESKEAEQRPQFPNSVLQGSACQTPASARLPDAELKDGLCSVVCAALDAVRLIQDDPSPPLAEEGGL